MTPFDRLRPLVPLWLICLALTLPCIFVCDVYFFHDGVYERATFLAESGTSMAEDFRQGARELEGFEDFFCWNWRIPNPGERDTREPLLRVLQSMQYSNAVRTFDRSFNPLMEILSWIERRDLAPFRPGYALYADHAETAGKLDQFELDWVRDQCVAQPDHPRLDDPPIPPIRAYAPLRALLRESADSSEVVLRRYAEVRPYLRALVYALIAFSVLGAAIGLYFIWVWYRLRHAPKTTPV